MIMVEVVACAADPRRLKRRDVTRSVTMICLGGCNMAMLAVFVDVKGMSQERGRRKPSGQQPAKESFRKIRPEH